METTETPMSDRLYIGTMGTTCYLDGLRGTTTGTVYGVGHKLTGVFVLMADTDEMRYAEISGLTGELNSWAVVKEHRVIDREEFDRLNGLDTMRAELGWKL